VCNGTVHLTDQYNSSASRDYDLSCNGTVVEFTTEMSGMNKVYNATFDLTSINNSFNGIVLNHQISKLKVA
jgi:hypothetical protein